MFDLDHAAHAYLDPGSGSILLQLLLGGFAGAAMVVKLYWHRLKAFFQRDHKPAAASNQDE